MAVVAKSSGETLAGQSRHAEAVARLCASYAAVPEGAPVRLAKRTSNLFRPRTAVPVAGLDVSGLTGVVAIDLVARTADVQGMCTYETLVAATLGHGLMPKVVPQLRTITVGGAVTGLGIESSSFRYGLPHESVLEIDVLTGSGDIVTASRSDHADLFHAFPNSYGSLGYAVRLRIELVPTKPYVVMRHVRFDSFESLADAVARICAERVWDGEPVEFLDGVVFDRTECYLTLARFADQAVGVPSDYTGQQIYYRSIRDRERDCLSISDYLWRWDTDWFWCSAAFGAQIPWVRRLWPRRWRRSDVYHRLIALDRRWGIGARLDRRRGVGPRERVVQDVEIPVGRTAAFLDWFIENVGMSPVWLCPLVLAEGGDRPWPLYPLRSGQVYVNVGFWGTVVIAPGRADGDMNREIERAVAEHGGHKSLYSDAFYDRDTFDAVYGAEALRSVKATYDPGGRLTGLYEKVVGGR